MLENCLVFTSLIQMMKNARRKLEIPMPAVKLIGRSTGRPVVVKRSARQILLPLLRPTSLRRSACKDPFTSIMKNILQEKE